MYSEWYLIELLVEFVGADVVEVLVVDLGEEDLYGFDDAGVAADELDEGAGTSLYSRRSSFARW